MGEITIKANATDKSGIDKVLFYVDNELLFEDNEEPYEYTYDGKHEIKVVAYDAFENYAEEKISIYVINI